MLRCNILTIFLAFSLLAGAQDWKVVRENSQKAFPNTVAAGNYSGIAHLYDDIYAVVSDKSDSALYFNFRIQVNPMDVYGNSVAQRIKGTPGITG